MPYCPHCGQEVTEDDRFCIECGTELDRASSGERSNYGWQSEPPSEGVIEPEKGPTAELTAGRLWAPLLVALAGVVQSVVLILYPQQVLDATGMAADLSGQVLMATGVLGLLIALAMLGLVFYYYDKGHADKQYFQGLVGIGIAGFLFGGGLLFLIPTGIGVYGLYAVVG